MTAPSRLLSKLLVVGASLPLAVLASNADIAGAAMHHDREAVRSLIERKSDVNAPQLDGATALHWAAHWDDLELAGMLIHAGANANAANRDRLDIARLRRSGVVSDKRQGLLRRGRLGLSPELGVGLLQLFGRNHRARADYSFLETLAGTGRTCAFGQKRSYV